MMMMMMVMDSMVVLSKATHRMSQILGLRKGVFFFFLLSMFGIIVCLSVSDYRYTYVSLHSSPVGQIIV